MLRAVIGTPVSYFIKMNYGEDFGFYYTVFILGNLLTEQ